MTELTLVDIAPHGLCECDGISCCGGRGPAWLEVTREGRRIKVCTRCDLTSDKDREILVQPTTPTKVFSDFDALGAMVIADLLQNSDALLESRFKYRLRYESEWQEYWRKKDGIH